MSSRKSGHGWAVLRDTGEVVSTHTSIWAAKGKLRELTDEGSVGCLRYGGYAIAAWDSERRTWIALLG